MHEPMDKEINFANRGKGIAQQCETPQAAETISYYRRGQETNELRRSAIHNFTLRDPEFLATLICLGPFIGKNKFVLAV